MRRSQRLEPVLDIATEAERKAATALATAETRVVEAEKKLAELERYAQEYRATLQQRTAGGIDVAQLRAFHGFIGRLGEATTQQGLVIQRAREERDAARERWFEASRRTRTVAKAVEQAATQERQVLERREQSDSDERAQRSFIAADRARRDAAAAVRPDIEES
jgi:flagellar FliJ protein